MTSPSSSPRPLRHPALESEVRDRYRFPGVRVLVESSRLVIETGEERDPWRLADLLVDTMLREVR